MTNREKDIQDLTQHLTALMEEYGYIEVSLPCGRYFLLRDGDQLLLRLSLGHRCAD